MAIVELTGVGDIIEAGELSAGQIGVVVESPIQRFLGWILIGGNDSHHTVFFALNTGDYWKEERKTGIKVRVLSTNEIVTLRND